MLDLPQEIAETKDAIVLKNVNGDLFFENVNFNYDEAGEKELLGEVKRYGSMDNVNAVLSLTASGDGKNGKSNGDADEAESGHIRRKRAMLPWKIFRSAPNPVNSSLWSDLRARARPL